MRVMLFGILVLLGSAASAARPSLVCRTDHPNALYRCGETARFSAVLADDKGIPLTKGHVRIGLDNCDESKPLFMMQADLSKTNSFEVVGTLTTPGFLRMTVDGLEGGRQVFAVGFEPERLRVAAELPEDFDAYWDNAVKKLDREVPIDVRQQLVPAKCNARRDYYNVDFATFGRRVYGWLSVPRSGGRHPLRVEVSCAGTGLRGTGGEGGDAVCLTFGVHDFRSVGDDAEQKRLYDDQDRRWGGKYGVPRYCQAGIGVSREAYFYYGVILGINRAVDWAVAQPYVDAARVRYSGTSQGGGFGMYLCGLNRHFTSGVFFVPALTDLLGYQAGRKSGWPTLVEAQSPSGRETAARWAPYFECAHFARRITCPTRTFIGFADTTCPPSAVYAAYNAIPAETDKAIVHGIGRGHLGGKEWYGRLGLWQRTIAAEIGLKADGVTVNGKTVTDSEWRHEPDGVAVRYRLPPGKRVISCEDTSWVMPEDAMCWYQVGIDSYESPYSWNEVKDMPTGKVLSLPITFRLRDGTYRLITEANLVDYTDLAVTYEGEGRFVARYHAEKGPFEQTGADTTPWRVMIVAKDLNQLANSDLVRRLCPPPTNAKSLAIAKPGRAIWQWLPANSPKYGEQRDWYDKTAALGFEYYLIDDGWRDWRDGADDQWACLAKAIAYGNSVGVKTAMWVHSKEMAKASTRRPYLEKVVKAGAVGIKIDFMPPCDSKWCKWYEETLAETAELGLFVDFHGAVKPTGRERTWPHELAREAIRGHEYHISRYHRILPPEHDTILPFCRLVQGHGDYTPVVFQPDQLVHFTWPRQLAQGIVMACPFLCFGDYPANYLASPMKDIVRALPATYDETVILPGSAIGDCVAMARRKGETWFVAVENASQVRELAIPLSFLGKGAWSLLGFADDPSGKLASCRREERIVGASDALSVRLNSCGGYVAMLTRR